MPTLQDVVFQRDLTPYLHVQLLDVDITDDLLSEQHNGIAGIENILDYPELNVFKSSNIILTLSNDDGRFPLIIPQTSLFPMAIRMLSIHL